MTQVYDLTRVQRGYKDIVNLQQENLAHIEQIFRPFLTECSSCLESCFKSKMTVEYIKEKLR